MCGKLRNVWNFLILWYSVVKLYLIDPMISLWCLIRLISIFIFLGKNHFLFYSCFSLQKLSFTYRCLASTDWWIRRMGKASSSDGYSTNKPPMILSYNFGMILILFEICSYANLTLFSVRTFVKLVLSFFYNYLSLQVLSLSLQII